MAKEESKKTVKKAEDKKIGRRKFLKKAAVAGAAGAATLGFPMVSRAQTTILKMQGAWGAKDIFNDYATDYVKRVNEMAGGRLKIQFLVSGAVIMNSMIMELPQEKDGRFLPFLLGGVFYAAVSLLAEAATHH